MLMKTYQIVVLWKKKIVITETKISESLTIAIIFSCLYSPLGHELKLCPVENVLISNCIGFLHKYLTHHSGWMLILGGCGADAMSMLTECRPRLLPSNDNLHGMVVITTSIDQLLWKEKLLIQYRPIEVKAFTLDEVKEFVGRCTTLKCICKEKACKTLHQQTAGSPSLLKRVIHQVLAQHKTVEEYFTETRNKGITLFKHMNETEFREIQLSPRADILLHVLCSCSPYIGVPLDMFKYGLLKALRHDLGVRDGCQHVEELRKLGNDLLKSSDQHEARNILKNGLKVPLKYNLVRVLGEDLQLVEVPELIQRSYLQYTKDSEANKCCRESQFALKIACLCLMEAMRAGSRLTKQLTPHLKYALAWGPDVEQLVFTDTSPVYIKATLVRHYVEDGKFENVIQLLKNLDPSEEELQNQETMTCFTSLARSHQWLDNLTESIRILERAAKACDAPGKGVILTHLASAETEAGVLDCAEDHFLQAQQLLDKPGVSATADNCFHLGLHEGGTCYKEYVYTRFFFQSTE